MKRRFAIILLGIAIISFGVKGQVAEQWASLYNGPGNIDDYPKAIAIDSLGNVYVSGYSEIVGADWDIVTIKYDPNGDTVWTARYDGTGNGKDVAKDIAVDSSGNVYVTGWSFNPLNEDYVTIKYNTAGVEQWVARYDGTGNGADFARAIAVDDSGYVYVIGGSIGSGINGEDCVTIKYSATGNEEWVARYNGPINQMDSGDDIAVDDSGNVYVTGLGEQTFANGLDYLTIKYNAAGGEQWIATYHVGLYDGASCIALDETGNVYVTGSFTQGVYWDYGTIKYNNAGVEQWAKTYNGTGNEVDGALAIGVDKPGNVYVTGQSRGSTTEEDYATVKYNMAGGQVWVKRYNGTGNSVDAASALAIDDSGYVYVTGVSVGAALLYDCVTIKYKSNGDTVWTVRYDGVANSADYGEDIAVDNNGCIYVTGRSYTGSDFDYATIKYCQGGVGMEEEATGERNVKVYPNPTGDEFIVSGDFSVPVVLEMYDVMGRLVRQFTVNGSQFTVDVRGLPAGLYIWNIGTARGKVVIE